jgi:Raf kinase inhibitor-like YbhB/YbcL family protein
MAVAEGSMFTKQYTCGGMNVSPDLEWTDAPAGTQGFAVILTDMSNALIHWAIWDIGSSASGLPEDVEKKANPGNVAQAKQVLSYDGQTYGYLGPCPPSLHTYQFVVYALDTASLPGVTTSSSRDEVSAAVKQHSLGSAALTAQANKQN